jgi:leucyl-tRNA synthetase
MHLGHLGTYLPADFTARYYRMKGCDVLFPMGFHVTGPATTGFARAIQRGDQEVVEEYHNVHRVSYEDIESFKDPERIVEYFSQKIRANFEDIGLSIDWRRTFMTKDEPYKKFIEWQFSKLDEGAHLVKGAHPIIWCDSCGNAVGEADRFEGEGAEITEFYILKFSLKDGTVLPAATLRPETVFGVTNMWLKPGGDYRRIRVKGEEWVVGKEAVDKLSKQKGEIEELGPVEAGPLFGETCRNPISGDEVPILPAPFVETDNATGVVMSVPAHAPIDHQALEDLRTAEELPPKVSKDSLESITPISLIEVKGLSAWPAVDIVKKMGIASQEEVDKLEKATQIIYKKEFYEGILGARTGKYEGKTVSEAKSLLSEDFISEGIADIMYETTAPVVCRCRTLCQVRVVEDQWFIDYGDGEWKAKTRELLGRMRVVPEKIRKSFEYYVDWMAGKPCARKIGFGTPFPLDPEWIVEPLSDSTIYMAYYTVARLINQNDLDPEKLTKELFDYVFLDLGELSSAAAASGLEEDLIEAMQKEYKSWYPNDIRFVGPDLIGNHATFFLYNHAAILPEESWPKGIAASGIVLSEGQKMSKSKGNAIPIADSLDEWGADIVRLWFAACAEFGQDINYEATLRNSVARRLAWFRDRIEKLEDANPSAPKKNRTIDAWLSHRMDERISLVEKHIENVSSRKAIQELMFETYNDIQYYLKRTGGEPDDTLLGETLDRWIRMMTPFAPHFCEEVWEKLGRQPFIINESWPEPGEDLEGAAAEFSENLVRNTVEDVKSIVAATNTRYTTLNIYVAEPWKRTVFGNAVKAVQEGAKVSGVISEAMKDPEIRKLGKAAASFIQQTHADLSRRPRDDLAKLAEIDIDEVGVLSEASEFMGSETGMTVSVQEAKAPAHDPEDKARRAVPLRPAIYLE